MMNMILVRFVSIVCLMFNPFNSMECVIWFDFNVLLFLYHLVANHHQYTFVMALDGSD